MKKLFAFTVSLFCLVTNVAAQTTKFLKVWTYYHYHDMLQKKILFRYLMLFVFLWGITSQIEAKKEKRVIIQGIEYSLTTSVGILYGSVDNLYPEQMKAPTCLDITAYVSYKGKSYPILF